MMYRDVYINITVGGRDDNCYININIPMHHLVLQLLY